jgi:hypothetical protein
LAFSLSFDVSHVGGCNGVGVAVMSRVDQSVKGGSRGGLAHREAAHEGNVNVTHSTPSLVHLASPLPFSHQLLVFLPYQLCCSPYSFIIF